MAHILNKYTRIVLPATEAWVFARSCIGPAPNSRIFHEAYDYFVQMSQWHVEQARYGQASSSSTKPPPRPWPNRHAAIVRCTSTDPRVSRHEP